MIRWSITRQGDSHWPMGDSVLPDGSDQNEDLSLMPSVSMSNDKWQFVEWGFFLKKLRQQKSAFGMLYSEGRITLVLTQKNRGAVPPNPRYLKEWIPSSCVFHAAGVARICLEWNKSTLVGFLSTKQIVEIRFVEYGTGKPLLIDSKQQNSRHWKTPNLRHKTYPDFYKTKIHQQ